MGEQKNEITVQLNLSKERSQKSLHKQNYSQQTKEEEKNELRLSIVCN